MGDQISALRDYLAVGKFGLPGEAGVTLQDVSRKSLIQISAWPDTLALTGAAAAQFAGVPAAPKPGQSVRGEKTALLRVEPMKWWMIGESSAGDHIDLLDLPPDIGSILDLSHSRTWIKVGGGKAEILLNHFLPLDLRKNAFEIGSVASSGIHHIGITLWRTRQGYELAVPRSFAASLWELLAKSAYQYGLEVI